MGLTDEQKKQLEELKKLEEEEKNSQNRDPEIDKMNEDELRKLTKDLLESKREARAEAKKYREKLESLDASQKEADRKKAELDMELKDIIKNRDEEIKKLRNNLSRTENIAQAKVALVAEGFPEKLINAGLDFGDDDSVDDAVKKFKREWKDFKKETDSDDHTTKPPSSRKDDENKSTVNPFEKSQSAVEEMRAGAKK